MLHTDQQPAYVLHARAYRETSLLLEVFSRDHGRVGLIARGVRGARGQSRRALLQPMQPLLLSWRGHGELMTLSAVEAAGASLALHGDALLSAFYLNELLLRLLPRGEPHTELFWRYAAGLGYMASPAAQIGWELRRFERDLLTMVGYGIDLGVQAQAGERLDPQARYRFDPETGPHRFATPQAGVHTAGGISGAALIALRDDQMPDAAGQRELRRLMRGVLLHHLGGRPLHAWQVLGDINDGLQLRDAATPGEDQA